MLADPVNIIIAIIAALSVMFCLNVIACAYALGRFHAWLKTEEELFGDTEGLKRHLNRL